MVNEETGDITEDINITQLARATALDVDVVKHTLSQFVHDNIIEIQGKSVNVTDLIGLKNIAG